MIGYEEFFEIYYNEQYLGTVRENLRFEYLRLCNVDVTDNTLLEFKLKLKKKKVWKIKKSVL